MQIKNTFTATLCAGNLNLGLVSSRAQTTATWIGLASGGSDEHPMNVEGKIRHVESNYPQPVYP